MSTATLLPAVSLVDLSNLKLSEFSAIAIPVISQPEPHILASKIISQIERQFEINLAQLLKQWPDATGKAGELIELPISDKKVNRIYLVGIGSQTPEEVRKSAISLARKVTNSRCQINNASCIGTYFGKLFLEPEK